MTSEKCLAPPTRWYPSPESEAKEIRSLPLGWATAEARRVDNGSPPYESSTLPHLSSILGKADTHRSRVASRTSFACDKQGRVDVGMRRDGEGGEAAMFQQGPSLNAGLRVRTHVRYEYEMGLPRNMAEGKSTEVLWRRKQRRGST
jgi:hypothetical protein